MARLGLGNAWQCSFANEWDLKKADIYRKNFRGFEALQVTDVHSLTCSDLPGHAALAWASFPCQDLSLAGPGGGLNAKRSGAFFGFWQLMQGLGAEGRAPPIVVLENVPGLLSSNKGNDFIALLSILRDAGYQAGLLIADAVHFLPQSRPRLFIIAAKHIPKRLRRDTPSDIWSSARLRRVVKDLPKKLQKSCIWFDLPPCVPEEIPSLKSLMIRDPVDVPWNSEEQTQALIAMMRSRTRQKLRKLLDQKDMCVATAYRRGRPDETGRTRQCVELRIDGIAGCLRTPVGGSSRQLIFLINGGDQMHPIRTRLLSPREGARLMGLPDAYCLPERYNDAYHVIGDGVAVPVVRYLSKTVLGPLAHANS